MPGVVAIALYDWNYFFAQLVAGLTIGSLYALLALGYTMVYGILKLLNFAHGDVYMMGAYFGYFTPECPRRGRITCRADRGAVLPHVQRRDDRLRGTRRRHRALRIPPAAARAADRSADQRPRRLVLSSAVRSPPLRTDPQAVRHVLVEQRRAVQHFSIGNLRIQYAQLLVIVSAIVLMVALILLVRRTTVGKAMRATSADLEAASMMGINVDRVIAFTFLIGSALAGAAGVMTGLVYQNINPYMGFGAGLKAFTAAVVGGIGNIQGAMLGGWSSASPSS